MDSFTHSHIGGGILSRMIGSCLHSVGSYKLKPRMIIIFMTW